MDQIQCILSDIEMPEMDGFTLTKHIRADPRLAHLPVMLHSSLTGACNMEKGKTVGRNGLHHKVRRQNVG